MLFQEKIFPIVIFLPLRPAVVFSMPIPRDLARLGQFSSIYFCLAWDPLKVSSSTWLQPPCIRKFLLSLQTCGLSHSRFFPQKFPLLPDVFLTSLLRFHPVFREPPIANELFFETPLLLLQYFFPSSSELLLILGLNCFYSLGCGTYLQQGRGKFPRGYRPLESRTPFA